MRNWHHNIIRLPQAIAKISNRSPLNIGVMEGDIEYEMLNNPDSFGFNYQAVNEGLQDSISKKVIHFIPSSPVRAELTAIRPSSHATSVAGVIGANDTPTLPIKGVLPESSIFNFKNSVMNFLVNSGIKWDIYQNNLTASNILDPDLKLDNSKLGVLKYEFDSNFTSEQASVPIINSSIAYKNLWDLPRRKDEISMQNSVMHMFNTIKAYSNKGRGTLICLAAGNDDKNTKSIQSLSNYNYPFIVAASCLTNGTTIGNSTEIRSGYSSYGDQIDLCAPSSGRFDLQKPPQLIKRQIFTTTNKFCGDIGTNSEVYKFNIKTVIGNNQITLDKINGLYPGNCIEIGDPLKDQHEVMIIKSIDPVNNLITFTKDRFFTIGASIVNQDIRVPVLKNSGTIIGSTLVINNPRGMGYIGQKIYIGNNSVGHETTIKSIISPASGSAINTTTFLLSSGIPANISQLSTYDIIPDQIVLKVKKHILDTSASSDSSDYIFTLEPNDQIKVPCAFAGGLMLLTGVYNNGTDPAFDVEIKAHIKQIDLTTKQITIEKVDLTDIIISEIKTIGYGSYTSSFGGTSSASPLVAGVAGLLLQANPNLNVLELKHILKEKANKIDGSYSIESNNALKNYGYNVNKFLGAGRINAEDSVQLALDWHDPAKSLTVFKPNLSIADKSTGYGIWIKSKDEKSKDAPNSTTPFNTINTQKDHKIYVKVLNNGNRESFIESDIRIYIAFTDDQNPLFPFPEKWYDQKDVKFLAIKDLGIISKSPAPGNASEKIIEIEWKKPAAFWELHNPVSANGLRKRAYILAHIAPFDGLFEMDNTDPQNPINLSLTNINKNKHLACREIFWQHTSIKNKTTYLPGNNLNINVKSEMIDKTFDLSMENVLTADLDTMQIKASKKNRQNQNVETVTYQRTSTGWEVENSSFNWINFETPVESVSIYSNCKNITFPHKLSINEDEDEIKLQIINSNA
ncbi:hypothetical protein L1276_002630 [Flavobacterium sp. HSC-32F16]|uniref:S8 family serine peptidase n=1 Tax=Flavobacterium sp. HSC-32F16 TaxID=2910964 RepID=UPI0020A2B884|nr:S8 family serine peptidase [Flavobacterium sp. HSC-32F16]MCP2027473.1 hypothetical protein [Flavobacterium sp. HSC-32F16]